MANAEGLGVLFTGFIQHAISASSEARELSGIGDEQIYFCILIGYPNVTYQRSTPRKPAQIEWR